MYPRKVFFVYQSCLSKGQSNHFKTSQSWWYDESITAPLRSINTSIGATWVTGPGRVEGVTGDSTLFEYRILDDNLGSDIIQSYYQEYCRNALRPTLFNCLELQSYTEESWQSFKRVNLAYAHTISRIAPNKSVILILDYPLMLIPQILKQIRPDLYISYYHHAPLPHGSISKSLPYFSSLLLSLQFADQLIFRSMDSLKNFRAYQKSFDKHSRTHGSKISNIKSLPKLNYAPFASGRFKYRNQSHNSHSRWTIALKKIKEKKPILITIFDHLEEHTGILKILEGIEFTLENRGDLGRHFNILLFCTPSDSTDYYQKNLLRKVFQLVARINGLHSQLGNPILSLYLSTPEPSERNDIYNLTDIFIANGLLDDYLPNIHEIAQKQHETSSTILASQFVYLDHLFKPDCKFNPYNRYDLSHKLANLIIRHIHSKNLVNHRILSDIPPYTIKDWLDKIMETWPLESSKARRSNQANQDYDDKNHYRPVG
jgi:trehalose 6-phosphate synthase/phosphatase